MNKVNAEKLQSTIEEALRGALVEFAGRENSVTLRAEIQERILGGLRDLHSKVIVEEDFKYEATAGSAPGVVVLTCTALTSQGRDILQRLRDDGVI